MSGRSHQRSAAALLGLCLIAFPFVALAATKTWDGGGSGNNCSTVANWSGDTKPTVSDDIVLDGTSTKDLTWDNGCPSGAKSWSQNSGYTGTASFSITNFTLTGGLTLAAGTFTAPSGTLTIRGTVTKTGGTFSHNNGTVLLAGTGAYTLDPGGASFSNLTLDNGLVGYWKFDEGTGTTIAKDSSRSGNNGTLTNGPVWSTSTPSRMQFYDPKSLSFNGTYRYVKVANASAGPLFDIGTRNFTVSIWATNTSAPAYRMMLSNWSAFGMHVSLLSSGKFGGYVGDGTELTSTYTIPTDGSWHHYVLTRTAGSIAWFVDGSVAGTSGSHPNSVGAAVETHIGTRGDSEVGGGQTQNWQGNVDDIRIYNRALSASEIKALYNGGKSTGSGTYTLGSALTVAGALNIDAGTLDVSGSNYGVNVGGNLNIEGDLTPRSGTVTLNGSGNQTVSGSTVFWNLTKSVSAAADLFLDYTARQNMSGALTLQGAAGNLLSIRSTRSGSGARLLLDGGAGTQTLTYLDVKDSNASGGAALSCLNCTDSGNNTNWLFTSDNNAHVLAPDAINSGGGETAKSNHYLLSDSIGEPIIGFGASANYILESGYRHSDVQQGILSFACSAAATIGSVAGTGQKTGSGSCTIASDSNYNLSWAVLSGSGGVSTGSLINQYNDVIGPFSPSVADTPDTWSVAASSAAWGARLSSASTDTNAEWGTDGASEKWLNVATAARTIVSRATPTSGGGSTEILQFRAEVGPSGFKPTGTYQATVTMTAVAL